MVDRKASVQNITDLSRFITPRVDLYVHRNAGNAKNICIYKENSVLIEKIM